jgi:hypothetical protein
MEPSVRTLLHSSNPMFSDLFRRLLKVPAANVADLVAEGYAKDVVMDSINALNREQWAAETSDQLLVLTGVGKRMLSQLVAELDSAQQAGGA